MVEKEEMFGTMMFEYDLISEFMNSLKESETKRLFTFYNGGLFGIGGNWRASFMDKDNNMHSYITHDLEDGFSDKIRPIYDLIEQIEVPEVDGLIKMSERNGSIYQVFQTESDDEERVQKSYDFWLESVLDLPPSDTLLQYLQEGEMTTVDATKGKSHYITSLDGEGNRNLQSVLNLTSAFKQRNNGNVIDWYKDMHNQ